MIQGLEYGGEGRRAKLLGDSSYIVISVWRTSQEVRRIPRKECFQCFRDDKSELVVGDSVPHIENGKAAWLEDAARLTITLDVIREKHHAELTCHDVKCLIFEWQCKSVGLPPCDLTVTGLSRGPRSSIGWLGSVATSRVPEASRDVIARVKTPVPAAVSSKSGGLTSANRSARSRAYGSKMRG